MIITIFIIIIIVSIVFIIYEYNKHPIISLTEKEIVNDQNQILNLKKNKVRSNIINVKNNELRIKKKYLNDLKNTYTYIKNPYSILISSSISKISSNYLDHQNYIKALAAVIYIYKSYNIKLRINNQSYGFDVPSDMTLSQIRDYAFKIASELVETDKIEFYRFNDLISMYFDEVLIENKIDIRLSTNIRTLKDGKIIKYYK